MHDAVIGRQGRQCWDCACGRIGASPTLLEHLGHPAVTRLYLRVLHEGTLGCVTHLLPLSLECGAPIAALHTGLRNGLAARRKSER